MNMYNPLVTIAIMLLLSLSSFSQCLQTPISLNDKIDQATLIVEAQVIDSTPQWVNSEKDDIITIHKLKPFTVYKGTLESQAIKLRTLGGQLEKQLVVVEPEVELNSNEVGIFFLKKTDDGFFEVYAVEQGYYKYDVRTRKANSIFDSFSIDENELPNLILNRTNGQPLIVNELDLNSLSNVSNTTASISSLSPTTIRAGMDEVLTINGSGFGNTQGASTVEFANANSGGSNNIVAPAYSFVSWSDTQIQIKVPTKAGTGNVVVKVDGGSTFISPSPLTINFHASNVVYQDEGYLAKHADRNSLGGYTFQMNTTFAANADAVNRTRETLAQWTANTGINWDISTQNTSISSAVSDGVNVISFDQDSQLPTGVLGRATSRYSGCSQGGVINWYVSEVDVIFDFERNWSFSASNPPSNLFDFYSVALHEFGHAHQLGHVINTNSVMHYAIGPGTASRTLSSDEVIGGTELIQLATQSSVCGQGAHVKIFPNPVVSPEEECTSITISNIEAHQWSTAKVGDNIVAQFNPEGNTGIATVDVGVFLITEDTYSTSNSDSAKRRFEFNAYDSNQNPVTFSESVSVRLLYDNQEVVDLLNVASLNDVTGAIIVKNDFTCGQDYVYNEASNVDFSFTQHPLGQDNYMLEVNGINEFSSFYLVSENSILPVKLAYFNAIAEDKTVLLNWETLSEENSKEFKIERKRPSENTWETIKTVSGAGDSTQPILYEVIDQSPYLGLNHYRLKQIDFDGSSEYSDIQEVEVMSLANAMIVYQNQVIIKVPNAQILRVIDVNGQVVSEVDLHGLNNVALDYLKTGVYIFQLIGENGVIEQKKAFLQ